MKIFVLCALAGVFAVLGASYVEAQICNTYCYDNGYCVTTCTQDGKY